MNLLLEEARLLAQEPPCTACRLSEGRHSVVFMRGSDKAKLLVIGEAPGATEDEQGLPFVGRSGEMLNQLLHDAGITQSAVAITNVVKCRPPLNRNPASDEIEACTPHIQRQIQALNPFVVITLGAFATKFIFGSKASVAEYRAQVTKVKPPYLFTPIQVIATYHPGAVLHGMPKLLPLMHRDFHLAAVVMSQHVS